MDTSGIGMQVEGIVLAALIRRGYTVLIPFGSTARYDLVYDNGERLVKVQCKAGRLRRGTVAFNTASKQRDTKVRTSYRGQVDEFAVWCPGTNEVYLVPVEEVPLTEGVLRVEPTKNNQAMGLRWAKDYVLR